jgi:hypothetical protein
MHKFNTARLEEFENEILKLKDQRKTCIGIGLLIGCIVTAGIWSALDYKFGPDIVYTHTHNGPRNKKSGSTYTVEGAVFEMPEKSSYALGLEGPTTFEEMMKSALDNFKQNKFFEQNNQSADTPIKGIEIKVWK